MAGPFVKAANMKRRRDTRSGGWRGAKGLAVTEMALVLPLLLMLGLGGLE